MFLPRLPVGDAIGEATIHFHCTDADGEWLITRVGDDVVVTREHAKGDVAARGSASDLALFLWGRVGADQLEVFGDAAAARPVPERGQGLGARARSVVRTTSPPARIAGAVVVTPCSA